MLESKSMKKAKKRKMSGSMHFLKDSAVLCSFMVVDSDSVVERAI